MGNTQGYARGTAILQCVKYQENGHKAFRQKKAWNMVWCCLLVSPQEAGEREVLREKQRLVTDKQVEVREFRKMNDHFRGIYKRYLKWMKATPVGFGITRILTDSICLKTARALGPADKWRIYVTTPALSCWDGWHVDESALAALTYL